MPEEKVEDQRTALLRAVEEAVPLLRANGEEHWASWLEKDARLVAAGDAHGVDHLLSAFGGMGSLNDLVLRDREADGALWLLRDQMWEAARALQREA